MHHPQTIQIDLPAGDPCGMRVAEIKAPIVRVIEVPRSQLADCQRLDRMEGHQRKNTGRGEAAGDGFRGIGRLKLLRFFTPAVYLADSDGFDARTLRELRDAVVANKQLIERTWNEHFA